MGASSRSDMRKLRSDIPAAYQQDPLRQFRPSQELFIVDEMLFARDVEPYRLCAHGKKNVFPLEWLVVYLQRVASGKPGKAVVGVDALLVVAVFVFLGNRIRETALESDQVISLKCCVSNDALALHALGVV